MLLEPSPLENVEKSELDNVGLKIVSTRVVIKKAMQKMRKMSTCSTTGGPERLWPSK